MVTMKSWGKTQNQARLGQAENLGWKQLSETHPIYHLQVSQISPSQMQICCLILFSIYDM
jgi:hypothetical protein